MTLSRLKTQSLLNIQSLYQTLPSKGEDPMKEYKTSSLDKGEAGGVVKAAHTIDTWVGMANMIANAFGFRSPYYTIGAIDISTTSQNMSKYFPDAIGNVVRAVSNMVYGEKQSGVIIDGLGDISGIIDVQFTTNPVMFVSGRVSDGRMRTPNKLNMKVYVSNYYSDNGTGVAVNYINSLIGDRGIASEITNAIFNGGNTRAQQALYKLRGLQETGRPFTIYTPHGVYENMLIQSLRPRTTGSNLDMLECDIVFEEVIMYQPYNSSTKAPARNNIITDNGSKNIVDIVEDKWNEFTKKDAKSNWFETRWNKIATIFGGEPGTAAEATAQGAQA